MTQIVQILTANGYSPSEVLDDTPLWLCRSLIDGLKYRDMHLRSEQRLSRFLLAQPWSSQALDPEDFGTFAWEDSEDPVTLDVSKMRTEDNAIIDDIREKLKCPTPK